MLFFIYNFGLDKTDDRINCLIRMESFKITHEGKEYNITPSLHKGFYDIELGAISAMLAKDTNGEWAFHLDTADTAEVSAAQIGNKIESYLKKQSKKAKY